MVLGDETAYRSLIGAAGLTGLGAGYVLHQSPALTLAALVPYVLTIVMVDPLNANYAFWTPLAYVLAVAAGTFAGNVHQSTAFVSMDRWLRSPLDVLRAMLVAVPVGGAAVAWALLPRQPWFWVVPAAAYTMAVLVSLFTNMPLTRAALRHHWEAHLVWLGMAVTYCLAVGLLESLHDRRYTPAYTVGALAVVLLLARLINGVWAALAVSAAQRAASGAKQTDESSGNAMLQRMVQAAADADLLLEYRPVGALQEPDPRTQAAVAAAAAPARAEPIYV